MKHSVTEIILKNGAKGLLVHIPDASVMTFDINFRAGEFLVADPKKWEVPHLMEHVLLGANELIPRARDFQAEIEKNGAYSNATTGVYDITYEAECADFEWDRVLGLLLVAITKPLFLEEEFQAEFGNVKEMVARANNHFRRLNLEMRRATGMIARTDTERLELMTNVQADDVREHYHQTHHTQNMRFVIAGDLGRKRRSSIETLFENIELPQKGKRYALPKEQPHALKKAVYIHNDAVENLYFYIDTFMQRRMSDPETDALNLVNTMLTETLYSKILGTARERGLVYGMSSGLSQTRDASNWWFGAQVSDKNAPALFKIIIDEVSKVMRSEVAMAEIDSAKQYALGRFQRSAQTVGGTANGYSGRYFFDGVIEDYYRIPDRIKAIEKDQIVKISRGLFTEKIWGLGVLGDCGEQFAEDLRAQLAPLWVGKE